MHQHQFILTDHAAQERIPQRGVPHRLLGLIWRYADEFASNRERGKAASLYLSQRSLDQMRRDGVDKKLIQEAEGRRHLRFVVDPDGVLITAKPAWRRNLRVYDRVRYWADQ